MKMKRITLILLALALSVNTAFADAESDFNKLVESKDYPEAAKLIPQVVKENPKDEDLIEKCGDVYTELEKYDKALEMYIEAEDIDDDNTRLLRKIAATNSALGKHVEAIEAARDAIKEDDGDALNLLALGRVYIAADSLKEAELYITKAKNMDESIPEPFIVLGDLYFADRVYELSKSNYESALKVDPENVEARKKLAVSYYWLGMREYDQELKNALMTKCLKEWNEVTQKDPKDAKAFFEQGKILFWSKKFEQAAQSLYNYVQLRPDGDLGRWFLGQSLYELRQCGDAEEHLRKSSENIDSVKIKAISLLARCYFDQGEYLKSTQEYEILDTQTELDATDIERWGAASFKTMDTTKAIDLYLRAIEMDPTKCKLAQNTGIMLYVLKRYDEAIDVLKNRLKNCTEEPMHKTYFFLGLCNTFAEEDSLNPIGRDSLAIDFFSKAIDLDSTDMKSRLYRADQYAKVGKKDESVTEFNYIINYAKQDTATNGAQLKQAYSKLSNMYFGDKNYSDLIKVTKEWAEYYPDSEWAYLYRAFAYQSLGQDNYPTACAMYKKVLTLNPKNKYAREYSQKLNCGGAK